MSRRRPTRTPGTLADSREEFLLGEPAQFAQQLRVAQTGRLSAGIGFGPGLRPLPAKAAIVMVTDEEMRAEIDQENLDSFTALSRIFTCADSADEVLEDDSRERLAAAAAPAAAGSRRMMSWLAEGQAGGWRGTRSNVDLGVGDIASA